MFADFLFKIGGFNKILLSCFFLGKFVKLVKLSPAHMSFHNKNGVQLV